MRVDVPVDVRGKQPFGTKKQIMKSLGTRDPREAERKLHAELALFHAACERVRAEQSPAFQRAKAQAVAVARPFPGEELEAAHMILNAAPAHIASQATQQLDGLEEGLSSGLLDRATFSLVDKNGDQNEISLPPYIALELLDNARELIKRERASLAPLDDNSVAAAPKQDDQNPSMRWLFERWKLERKPSTATANNYETSLRAFEKLNGDLHIRDLIPAHVRQFKDGLVSAGAKAATINKHLSALRAITRYAKANDFIRVDPAAVIKLVAATKGEKRQLFTPAELKLLFDGVTRNSAEWWIMRTALFTGMRQDEIAQLTREDIIQTEGVWAFDVNDKNGKRIKNSQSARRVPVHQKLLDEGLLAFLPKSGRLFPRFKDTPGKKAAQRVSAWFTLYRRSIGIVERYKDFHSFRHTFITAARIVMVEEDYIQITGHKSDNRVNRAYGTYSLAKLKQEIDKVDWAI
jgi:integrase